MIVTCGEALIDLVPVNSTGTFEARPGGAPLNVAVGLGRLGVDVALLARLAGDRFGLLLRAHLRESRVRTDLLIRSRQPTTLAVLHVDRAGVAAYAFYIDGCADGGWRVDDLPADLDGAGALVVSGALALPVPAMGRALEALADRERPHRVIGFDPNIRPSLVTDEAAVRAGLARWIARCDVVKASAEDVAWIAPGQPVEAVARDWFERGPRLVVVTRGPHGAYALGPAGAVDLPGQPVTVVDTVGAGDAFLSGLLAVLERNGRLNRPALAGLSAGEVAGALRYAQEVAAFTCGRQGADPPWLAELADGPGRTDERP